MTTTIKLNVGLRDRLKQQAAAAHRTLGEQVEYLVELGDRQARFDALRSAIADTPDNLMSSYRAETAAWEPADTWSV